MGIFCSVKKWAGKTLRLGRGLQGGSRSGSGLFIEKFWDKKHTGWAWVTDRKGNVLDNGKLVYGQTFAIYALAEIIWQRVMHADWNMQKKPLMH